jgi:hypothetical protein
MIAFLSFFFFLYFYLNLIYTLLFLKEICPRKSSLFFQFEETDSLTDIIVH